MRNMICKTCGGPRAVGRKDCTSCHKQKARERSKVRSKNGVRTKYVHTCLACKKPFETTRKKSGELCRECKLTSIENTKYSYSDKATGRLVWEHRVLAEKIIGRRLSSKEVVHHLDGDGTNNDLENLLLISLSDHGKLHHWLKSERVIWEKSRNENSENCWKTLIVTKTTTWLETAGVKVIKLSELGNQQPSP